MNDVFILGAGFSKAIFNRMPITKELSSEVVTSYQGTIEPDIRALIEDDFEKALTFLSQHKPWLRDAENLRHKALYLDLTSVIRHIFVRNQRDPRTFGTNDFPIWMQYLLYFWHEHRCAVITLNYDTLIERLASVQSWKLTKKIPTGQLYPVNLTPASLRSGSACQDSTLDTFKLFKLHGSVNWFYSGRSNFFGENLYYVPCIGGADEVFNAFFYDQDAEKAHWTCLGDKVALIIPPTLDKSVFFEHETLQSLWFQAGEAIKRAERIICMGYSLPSSDLTMAQFLRSCAPEKRIPFEIVNLEAGKQGHFEAILLKDVYDVKQDMSGENCIPRYVAHHLAQDNADRDHILRML
jgi:hypothetical protein